jgi:hypothetical protein
LAHCCCQRFGPGRATLFACQRAYQELPALPYQELPARPFQELPARPYQERFGVSVCFVMTTVNVDSDVYTSLTRRS